MQNPKTMCQYKTKILHWVDGDGLLCPIDLGFHPHKEKPIQLARIDPPELGAEGNKEGNALKELLTQRNLKGPTLTLEKKKKRKYASTAVFLANSTPKSSVLTNGSLTKNL